MTLPLAAERDLARVLGYEMDRLTPFRADEVFFSAAIAGRDRARGQLRARLFLVPRAAVAPLLALLREAGAPPPELEATDETGALRPIPLRTVLCAVRAATGNGARRPLRGPCAGRHCGAVRAPVGRRRRDRAPHRGAAPARR